eukprot:771746-Lingulodinium_polyedra.AAC.1
MGGGSRCMHDLICRWIRGAVHLLIVGLKDMPTSSSLRINFSLVQSFDLTPGRLVGHDACLL